jgi:hypothetical protein
MWHAQKALLLQQLRHDHEIIDNLTNKLVAATNVSDLRANEDLRYPNLDLDLVLDPTLR